MATRFRAAARGSLAAVAGYPHLTVPMGQVRGLPVGLSFIGAKWDDARILALGYAYEQASHRRVEPRFLPSIEESPEVAPHLRPAPAPQALLHFVDGRPQPGLDGERWPSAASPRHRHRRRSARGGSSSCRRVPSLKVTVKRSQPSRVPDRVGSPRPTLNQISPSTMIAKMMPSR